MLIRPLHPSATEPGAVNSRSVKHTPAGAQSLPSIVQEGQPRSFPPPAEMHGGHHQAGEGGVVTAVLLWENGDWYSGELSPCFRLTNAGTNCGLLRSLIPEQIHWLLAAEHVTNSTPLCTVPEPTDVEDPHTRTSTYIK